MKLNVMSPWNDLGYGVAAKNIIKSLDKAGVDVTYWQIGQMQYEQDEVSLLNKLIGRQNSYDVRADCLKIYHQHLMGERIGRGTFTGFPFFELDTFNEREKHHLGQCDRIFVSSKWAKEIVKKEIKGADVRIIPPGVDRTIFNENQNRSGFNGVTTNFYNIGKWEVRKGHDVLIDIWNKAFGPEFKNVRLNMLCNNPFLKPEQSEEWQKLYSGPSIKVWPRLNSHVDVAYFMNMFDCGVFPSRGEAINLEAIETLSCGGHLVITNYAGHTEFCNKENSRLIDIDETEIAFDGIWFHGTGDWAKIGERQIEQAVEHLREVHRLNMDGQLGLNKAGIETAKHFSWDNAAKHIIEVYQ